MSGGFPGGSWDTHDLRLELPEYVNPVNEIGVETFNDEAGAVQSGREIGVTRCLERRLAGGFKSSFQTRS